MPIPVMTTLLLKPFINFTPCISLLKDEKN
jgi:hypothetical protein